MNSYVKWIFVVLLICSLTAFVEKDKPTGGLSEGDVAPDFKIESASNGQPAFKLGNLKGKYVLLSQSIFKETVRKDQIVTPTCFVETEGEDSGLFKKYRLNRGFTNYLLDGNGVIIAKNISAADLSAYVKEVG